MNEKQKSAETVSRGAVIAMVTIVLILLLVAIFANWENWHRDRFEKTTVTLIEATPSAAPSPTSSP